MSKKKGFHFAQDTGSIFVPKDGEERICPDCGQKIIKVASTGYGVATTKEVCGGCLQKKKNRTGFGN